MNLNEKFMREISKIQSPEVFLGVAKVLGVRLLGEEKDENGKFAPKDFVEIFSDLMEKYAGARRKFKRELLDLVEKANRSGDNGNSTKDSKEDISD